MPDTPRFKIYEAGGRYRAATKGPMAALCLCAHYFGKGSTIKYNHQVLLWTEGPEGDGPAITVGAPMTKEYDRAYKIMEQRRGEWDRERAARAQKRIKADREELSRLNGKTV
jgi:hypothetical protein